LYVVDLAQRKNASAGAIGAKDTAPTRPRAAIANMVFLIMVDPFLKEKPPHQGLD